MPKIPEFQRRNRLSGGGLTEAANRGGELSGENIQRFGAQLSRSGSDIVDLGLALFKDHGDKLKVKQAQSSLIEADLTAQEFAKTNGAEDGSDVSDLYKSKYQELSNGILNNLTGANREQASLDSQNIFQNGIRSSFKIASARGINALNNGVQEELNKASSRAALNPQNAQKEMEQFSSFVKSMPALYDDKNSQKAIAGANNSIARSAINGLVEAGKYDQAKGLVNKEFAAIFDAEDSADILKSIDDKEVKNTSRSLQRESERSKLDKDNRRKSVEMEFDNLMLSMNDNQASSMSIDLVKANAKQKFDNGLIDKTTFDAIEKVSVDVPKTDAHYSYKRNIYKMLDSDASITSIRNEVKKGMADNAISLSDANDLFAIIDSRKDISFGSKKEERKRVDYYIKKKIHYDPVTNDEKKAEEYINVQKQRAFILSQNPGISELKAADMALEKVSGISKESVRSIKDIDEDIKVYKKKYDSASTDQEKTFYQKSLIRLANERSANLISGNK